MGQLSFGASMGRMSVCVHLLLVVLAPELAQVQSLQVSHQMVQRGHAPAIESTVYHTKYGYHAPAPHHGYGHGYSHPAPAKYASEPPVHYSVHHPKPSPYVAKPQPAPVYQYIREEPAAVTPSVYEPAHAVPIVDATLYRGAPAPVNYEPVPAPSVHAVHAVPAPVHHGVHHAVHAPVHHVAHAPVHHAVHGVPAPLHHGVHLGHHTAHQVAHPNYIQPSYDVKPHHVVHQKSYAPPPPVYPDEPRLYKYAYSVDDDYEGAVLNVKEASDEYATH